MMVKDNPESYPDLDGHDCCDVWNVINFLLAGANAYFSDNAGGYGRQQQTTTSGKLGQVAGDASAFMEGSEKVGTAAAVDAASVPADATGVGALAGVPAAVVATAIGAQGTVEAGTAGVNLIKDVVNAPAESRRVGDFSQADKDRMDAKRAAENGGTIKCTECGQDVEKIQNEAGEKTPGNQLQRHHDPPLSKGGNSASPGNRIVCRTCHVKIHKSPGPPSK